VNEELKQYFRPEFLNRLDEIIVFRQLSKAEVKEIADIMLKEVRTQLANCKLACHYGSLPNLLTPAELHAACERKVWGPGQLGAVLCADSSCAC